MKNLFLLMSFLILASCGGSSSGPKNNSLEGSTETLVVDGSNIQGIYRADFITLNGHVNGSIPGGVTLKRVDDKLYAYSRIFAGGPEVFIKKVFRNT